MLYISNTPQVGAYMLNMLHIGSKFYTILMALMLHYEAHLCICLKFELMASVHLYIY